MMESTKVRSRDRACAKRSMARSFVAFGAGGHVAAPRVFPLSLEQLRASICLAVGRTVDAVVRHPLLLVRNWLDPWILWAGSNYFVPTMGCRCVRGAARSVSFAIYCATPDCMANLMRHGQTRVDLGDSSMLVAR